MQLVEENCCKLTVYSEVAVTFLILNSEFRQEEKGNLLIASQIMF
jgi:hypothetical protein